MTEIPEGASKLVDQGNKIPLGVLELPQDQSAPEVNPYVISFVKYNDRLCEVSILSSNKARKAIEKLKIVGTKIRCQADYQRYNIDRIPIKYEGEYKKLFNGLNDDVELKEIKLQQDARIFYFDIEPERTFYVVAITENHLETKKVRR